MSKDEVFLKRIILADDDVDDCDFFSEALNRSRFETRLTTTTDGVHLMERLHETVPPQPYAIFLDLNMPRKNGYECLAEIRQTPKLKYIPIIILSTSSNRDIIDQTYKLGANYYMCKPTSISRLTKFMESILALNIQENSGRPTREEFEISV